MKKDKDDEIFDSLFWLIMLVILVLYIISLCCFIWYPDRVFADQQIETRRFPSGKVKVDGVEIAGTDRNFDLPKGWEASVVQYDIRSYPSDTVYSYGPQAFDGFLRFLKGAKDKGYVTNKVTFVVISKNGIVHEIKSGTKASFFDKNNKPIEFNLKKPWREFDGKTPGVYLVDGDYFKNLQHRPDWAKDDNTLGYWGLDVNTPKEVDEKLVPSGQRVQQFQSLSAIWGSNGYAPQSPTRDVLTEYSEATPPADGVSHAYDYFKRSGDAVISNSVLVKENGQFLSGNKYEAMKDKAKMSLNWVNVEVDENAFENDAKEKKQKEKQEEDKKKSEKDEKGKNWWDKLLSWLLYDEDFVKEQFNSVIAGVGAPEGTRAFEVNSNGGGVLYEWALNQGDGAGISYNSEIYGGIEVVNQLGTGYTHSGYWQTISKNFTKFIFTMTANYFIMKKFYKRLK
ncbi:hypothetical protein [Capnocytophaga sputigena]|uniref:hypothetical protein n=1 Tax=Capnocytophaga sputigena TaxID=1019 RepID=UPI0024201203